MACIFPYNKLLEVRIITGSKGLNIFMFIKILPTHYPNEPYHFVLAYLSVPFRASSQAPVLIQCLGVMGTFDEVSHLISIPLEGGQGRHCIPPFVTATSSALHRCSE